MNDDLASRSARRQHRTDSPAAAPSRCSRGDRTGTLDGLQDDCRARVSGVSEARQARGRLARRRCPALDQRATEYLRLERFDGTPPLRNSGSGHVGQHRLDRIVRGARERTTLDLRGLGPALRAHAKARNMAVSSVARMAVATMLENSGIVVTETLDVSPEVPGGPSVKLTFRVSPRIAGALATRARASGLSHGAYVSTLIDATPVAVDQRESVRALAVSTDRLASAATDLKGFARLLRRGASPSADHVDAVVAAVFARCERICAWRPTW